MHVSTNRSIAHLRGERGNQVVGASEHRRGKTSVMEVAVRILPGARLAVRLDKTARGNVSSHY